MNVKINDDCTGCGACASLCGEVFKLKGEKAQVIAGADMKKNAGCIKEAKEACPAESISIS